MSHHKNYNMYRTKLQTCEQPLIPFIAIHLSDLTFINENEDKIHRHKAGDDPTRPPESPRIIDRTLSMIVAEQQKKAAEIEAAQAGGAKGEGDEEEDEDLLINFNKMELVCKVLNLLRGFQAVGFERYQPASYLQKYFGGMEAEEREKFTVLTEKDIYTWSLKVEPKVTKTQLPFLFFRLIA